MYKKISIHSVSRIFSFAEIVLAFLAFLSFSGRDFSSAVTYALLSANVVLLMYPKTYESALVSLRLIAIFLLLSLALPHLTHGILFLCAIDETFLLGYFIFRTIERFRRVRILLGSNSVWYAVEDYSQFFYAFVFAFVSTVSALLSELSSPVSGFAAVLPLCLFFILYFKAYTGRSCIFSNARESQVRELMKGNMRALPPENLLEDSRMTDLYGRAVSLMETKKVYLDDGLGLQEMSRMLYTNKSYLSRTINLYSGTNFCQFINRYRVNYSLELIKRDPHLRVTELAVMSGFHSAVSFNLAFQMIVGISPGEYIRQERDKQIG